MTKICLSHLEPILSPIGRSIAFRFDNCILNDQHEENQNELFTAQLKSGAQCSREEEEEEPIYGSRRLLDDLLFRSMLAFATTWWSNKLIVTYKQSDRYTNRSSRDGDEEEKNGDLSIVSAILNWHQITEMTKEFLLFDILFTTVKDRNLSF